MTTNALSLLPTKTASCPAMGSAAKKAKQIVPWANKKIGDVIEFDFNHNGTPDHTGILVKINSDGSITTIEGNTSLKSDDNGGCVMLRTRYKKDIPYFVRPKYNDKVTAQMIIGTAYSQLGIKEKPRNSNNVKYNTWFYGHAVRGNDYAWCMTFVEWLFAHALTPIAKPNRKYSGSLPAPTIKKGDKGANVKKLQKFLTWYGIKTDDDGNYGYNTKISVIIYQLSEGLMPDGVFGKKSYIKGRKYMGSDNSSASVATSITKSSAKKSSKKTTTYGGSIPKPTLKKGSKGAEVTKLQKFFEWYFSDVKFKNYGTFGKHTEKVQKMFQKAHGLKQTGVYGESSYKKAKAYKKSATNAQKIVNKAKELAWPYGTPKKKRNYKTGAPTKLMKAAMKKYGWADSKAEESDCGNAASTIVRESGVDKSFKALHGVKTPFPKSEEEFNIPIKGRKIKNGELEAGDIIRYKKKNGNQHVLISMGNGMICEASHYKRFCVILKDNKKYNKVSKIKTIQVLRAKQ